MKFIDSPHWDKYKDLGRCDINKRALDIFNKDTNDLLPKGYSVKITHVFNKYEYMWGLKATLYYDDNKTDIWCMFMKRVPADFLAEHLVICYERFSKEIK